MLVSSKTRRTIIFIFLKFWNNCIVHFTYHWGLTFESLDYIKLMLWVPACGYYQNLIIKTVYLELSMYDVYDSLSVQTL